MTERDIVYVVPLSEDEALEKIAEYPRLEERCRKLSVACAAALGYLVALGHWDAPMVQELRELVAETEEDR
jgi:hypothetical protein